MNQKRLLFTLMISLISVGFLGINKVSAAEPLSTSTTPPYEAIGPTKVPLGTALWTQWMDGGSKEDPFYTPAFLKNYNSITAENEMKMFILQPERGKFDFTGSDKLVDLAQANGMRVRGHTLIYEQNPGWVEKPAGMLTFLFGWSREDLLLVMKEHITTVMDRYEGRVTQWDVVNEAFDDNGNYKNNVWYKYIGKDYIKYAYQYAREADPSAKLYYNEYNADKPNLKTKAIIAMVKELRAQGVNIDGIGMEMHLGIGGNYPSHTQLQTLMKSYGDLGLEVEFTELDVGVGAQSEPIPQAMLDEQAMVYDSVVSDCTGASNCKGITVWGLTDKYSWRGSLQAATLLDGSYGRKPAFDAVRRLVEIPQG